MKIVVNTENTDLLNMFIRFAKESGHEIIGAKMEHVLFEQIEQGSAEAYILSNDTLFFKKAVGFIKKSTPYTPIIGIIVNELTFTVPADIYVNEPMKFEGDAAYNVFVKSVVHNILSYTKTFEVLQKLTVKMHDKIEFAKCVYDPTRRILSYNGKEVKELSPKEGSILEVLAINYGQVVRKEVILEKVWRKPNDYFAGRSCDVYLSYLRKTFKENKIKLNIKNISGIGLILEPS